MSYESNMFRFSKPSRSFVGNKTEDGERERETERESESPRKREDSSDIYLLFINPNSIPTLRWFKVRILQASTKIPNPLLQINLMSYSCLNYECPMNAVCIIFSHGSCKNQICYLPTFSAPSACLLGNKPKDHHNQRERERESRPSSLSNICAKQYLNQNHGFPRAQEQS